MSEGEKVALTSGERKRLRGMAHNLEPVGFVGRSGLSDGVVAEIDQALAVHELIKIRLQLDREERKQVATELAARLGAALAGLVGRVAILYRAHPDPEKRLIRFAAGD